jgi:hypothetical protein
MSLDLAREFVSRKVAVLDFKQKREPQTYISIQLMFLPKHIRAPAPKAKKNLCMSP